MSINPTLTQATASYPFSSQTIHSQKQEETESSQEPLSEIDKQLSTLTTKIEEMNRENTVILKELEEVKAEEQKIIRNLQINNLEMQELTKSKNYLSKVRTELKGNISSILESAKAVISKTKKCCGDTVCIPLKENGYDTLITSKEEILQILKLYHENSSRFVTKSVYTTTRSYDLENYMLSFGMVIESVSQKDYFSYHLPNNLSFGLSSSDSKDSPQQILGFSGEVNGQRPFTRQESTRDTSKLPEGEGVKPKNQINTEGQVRQVESSSVWVDYQNNCLHLNNISGIDHNRKFLDFADCVKKSQQIATELTRATQDYSENLNLSLSIETTIVQKREHFITLQTLKNVNDERFKLIQAQSSKLEKTFDQIAKFKNALEKVQACPMENDPQALLQANKELQLAFKDLASSIGYDEPKVRS